MKLVENEIGHSIEFVIFFYFSFLFSVHQCLFCAQTFNSAVEKDDHILEHFAHETCGECNRSLIRIGGNLYTLHNVATCVAKDYDEDDHDAVSFDESYLEDVSSKLTTVLMEGVYMKSDPNENDETNEQNPFDFETPTFHTEEESTTNTSDCMTQSTVESNPDDNYNKFFAQDIKPHFLMANSIDPVREFGWNSSFPETKIKRRVVNGRIECEICGQFFHRYALYRHRRDVHNPIVCVCDICNTKFKSEEYLQRHKRYKHGVSPRILKCQICNETFRKEVSMRFHQCPGMNMTNSTPEPLKVDEVKKGIPCEMCGKEFSRKQTLQKHKVLFHSQTGTIYCNICGRLFATEMDRNSHQVECELKKRIQHASNPMPCEICGKVLSRKGALQRHKQLVHTK